MLGVAVNKSPLVNRSESVLSLITHNADDGSSGQQRTGYIGAVTRMKICFRIYVSQVTEGRCFEVHGFVSEEK